MPIMASSLSFAAVVVADLESVKGIVDFGMVFDVGIVAKDASVCFASLVTLAEEIVTELCATTPGVAMAEPIVKVPKLVCFGFFFVADAGGATVKSVEPL